MLEPLRLDFEVGCSAAQAFATWSERVGTWRERNVVAWRTLLPHYRDAVA